MVYIHTKDRIGFSILIFDGINFNDKRWRRKNVAACAACAFAGESTAKIGAYLFIKSMHLDKSRIVCSVDTSTSGLVYHLIFKQLENLFNLHLDATHWAFTGQSNPSPLHRSECVMEQ